MGLPASTSLRRDVRQLASAKRAVVNGWFFKTGKGEYGEGDRFLGIRVPDLRTLARKYQDLERADLIALLRSRWHEERLLALLILGRQYERGDRRSQSAIHQLYLRNTKYINNWDLVDLSAAQIVGAHLGGNRSVLRRLAKSTSLWERRIAIISTFHFIRQREYDDALGISELLLDDDHDLIHKAVGWMLREIGNRDRVVEERFLKKHADRMPRTMLRYAIERFPEPLRRQYLARRQPTAIDSQSRRRDAETQRTREGREEHASPARLRQKKN